MSEPRTPPPLLVVISSPSGGGKSTLCRRLLEVDRSFRYSISCTTRAPRTGETNGVHYHFLAQDEFRKRQAAGEFLESAEVHGHLYGTPLQPVRDALAAGKGVVLAIDVQGAAQIRERIACCSPDDPVRRAYVDVFILPPSMEVLEARLRGRGDNEETDIQRRLANARRELEASDRYDHRIENDDLARALGELRSILTIERARRVAG